MKLGIVGLPNVGKSTLFNAITKAGAQAANYPFCTIDPNIGIVPVPDSRLNALANIYHPEKITPATIEFVDIAGLVKGASKGEGLGNRFLANIREVDAIVHVVRCFDSSDIVHVDGSIDPVRDVETIELELIFADIESIEKQIDKAQKASKSGREDELKILSLLERIKSNLEDGVPVRNMKFSDDEKEFVQQLFLLTDKPIIYVANISENDIGKKELPLVEELKAYVEGTNVIEICAGLEEEIAQLDEDEKLIFLKELGIEEPGLDKLIRACYELLGLISYLTVGPDEVRAWTIKKGTKAPQAAGKIHTDFERGFIRAEVIAFDDLIKAGSSVAAREKGLIRLEGKDYVVQDGDVILFRFNV
ncbi:MAG TPA: redox-regulated ATPase YchF [Clostridiales bacterium]|nr:redox-regulated ATPase YchF [Clostridiales bacterium]